MTGEEIRKKAVKLAVLLIVAVAVICTGYVMVVLNWSYSKGERVGYVQKFSEKGWLCKTWEGELAMVPIPGTLTPQIFNFTVRSDSLAKVLEQDLGKRVSLTYEQHRGVPSSCFGETEYFVSNVRIVGP